MQNPRLSPAPRRSAPQLPPFSPGPDLLKCYRCAGLVNRVRFITAAALVHELLEARDEKRLLRFQKQLAKQDLLIIDEFGYVPLSKSGAEMLFEVFSQRYERSSTMVTSNLQRVDRDPRLRASHRRSPRPAHGSRSHPRMQR